MAERERERDRDYRIACNIIVVVHQVEDNISCKFFFFFSDSSYHRIQDSRMEQYDGNIFQRQAQPIPKTNDKVGKPPTRLQKQAPRALDLDQLSTPLLPASQASPPPTPIPLLSPLSVSPPPLPSEAEEFTFPVICGDNDKGREDDVHDASSEARVWQHPAVASGYIEPSSLFTFFQSKCLLVDHAQS